MDAFRRDLDSAVDGEVRFDRVSRGIYSTDAGPYQVFPTGVLIPKSRADVVAALAVCKRHGVAITARGGGTSQGGQAVGRGLQIDFSKYMRRILGIDAAASTVRVEPGIVLAELNAALQPHGLELPLDLSTANRATIGGMVANNSAGARSIVYGVTADYIVALEVLLADGSIVTMTALEPAELAAKCAQDDLEGACYRAVRDIARDNADEIRRRFPKILRRNGGYRLDAFVPAASASEAAGGGADRGGIAPPGGGADRGGIAPPGAGGEPIGKAAGEYGASGAETMAAASGVPDRRFNLAMLIAGSEGTLGLVLSATLRLVRPPAARVLGVAQFDSLRGALAAVPSILEEAPAAVELMDRNLLDMTAGKPELEPLRDFVAADAAAVLIVEFIGDQAAALPRRLEGLEAALAAHPTVVPVYRAVEAAAQARVWKLRRAGLGLSMSEIGDTKGTSFVEDTAVAPQRLAEYVDRFQGILDRHGARAVFYAHASVGLLHIRPAINLKTAAGIASFERIAAEVAELVLEFNGALSGEHGDGMVRSPFQQRMFGAVLYRAFRDLKAAFDADNVLNPGKIVDAEPLTENLRYGVEYRTNELATGFDFSDFGGIAGAAEQCGGVGACRKTLAGTMCPSYVVTRDEADNTRGRATALRLAISGQLGFTGLSDPALRPVLDFCLECKACKTECPTGVDMARLKSEFLYQQGQAHGYSARARLLAHIARAAPWGSRAAPLSNWTTANPLSAWLLDKTLGIDRRRSLPRFARHTFVNWWSRRGGASAPANVANVTNVAIFADTFTNHYEPHLGRAATRIAEKLGLRVVVPPRVCCGRPLISKGFLRQARQQAAATTRALTPLARAGTPIVFCEPGCFSAVRDDHPKLVGGELQEAAEAVAAASVTFEEWANAALSDAGLSLTGGHQPSPTRGGQPSPTRVLLHAHCHQKALVGSGPAARLLGAIPDCAVLDTDAACCGMAGSFGYEREHYELSRAVGEQRLFPAVREADPGTVIVAPGFSCRHQVRHFTGVRAVSAIELIEPLVATRPADARPADATRPAATRPPAAPPV